MNSQLNLGAEISLTYNNFEGSNFISIASNKRTAYINYKFKTYVIEAYFGYDFPLTSIIDNIVLNLDSYEVGILGGIHSQFSNYSSFTACFGPYFREFEPEIPFVNFGNRIGLMGKIQYGQKIGEGVIGGITYRGFRDMYNLSDDQNQSFLVQSSFCFTLEVSLTEFYKKIKQKKINKKK